LLGIFTWIPEVHAEEAGALSAGAVETEGASPEHGKINAPDASPVDPGHFEIESNFTLLHSKRYWDKGGATHDRGLEREQSLGISVTVGVIENVDVAVSGSYAWIKDKENDFDSDDAELGPESGHDFGDLELSGRYRFYESKEHSLSLAYIGGSTIPTGSSLNREEIGTSQEFWSFNQTLVASKDLGQWTANADVGYALPLGDKRENARGTVNANVAVGYQYLPWLQPELELNYGYDFLTNENNSEILAATAGLVMPINDQLRLNMGVQQGFWGRNNDKDTTLSFAAKLAF
jgi:hypothetical protein